MGLDLKRAQGSLHKTTVDFPVGNDAGDTELIPVDIWFRPITVKLLEEMDAESGGKEMGVVEAKTHWLARSLVRWSITSDEAETKPDYATLSTLNRLQLDALIEAVSGYTYPKSTT